MELLERERELAALDALVAEGGVLVVEGGAGIGKTALLEAAVARAGAAGRQILRARGSELEGDFPFGVVRRLFERRLAGATPAERRELLAGAAAVAGPVVGGTPGASAADASFAVLHGLYWLTINLAERCPALLLSVDDAHWADSPSLRWLAYLVLRIESRAIAVVVAMRPPDPGSSDPSLIAVRDGAATVVRPALLSLGGVARLVRSTTGADAGDERCRELRLLTGGNPLYLREVLLDQVARRTESDDLEPTAGQGLARRVAARVRALDPEALRLAQALAVLGDGCELRSAASIAGLDLAASVRLAAGLVRVDVLESVAPVRFRHPVLRSAVQASTAEDELDRLHRAAAREIAAAGAPPGRVAAHLARVLPGADPWVLARLREGARAAMESGAPEAAAALLRRALAEPPPPAERVAVLGEAALAEAGAGREAACALLEEALAMTADPLERAELALRTAEAYSSLFRWVEAVDLLEGALAELDGAEPALASRLEAQLVVSGLHDARRAASVQAVLGRLAPPGAPGPTREAVAVARGMADLLRGRPAAEVAAPLEAVLAAASPSALSWDTRAALLWTLVTAERFDAVERALGPMLAEVHRSGSARGMIAVYSTLGVLKLRLGALPEADAAARVALRVVQSGDFAGGLPFAATVLAQVAIDAGELEAAAELVDLLPQDGWPAGVGTVLIPATRGRLRLAEGRPAEALADFQACAAMFGADRWGVEMRDVGYLHARSGAALALIRLGELEAGRELADAELADVSRFGAPRALGISLRTAGLARGGPAGRALLERSALVLEASPAMLERARSLLELGAALRRSGARAAATAPLSEALDLAARCGARPVTVRAREELHALGARPRRDLRRGVEALTPSELRVARLAAEGRTNREIAHELYVTLKTVEGHLRSAYGKLGIAGRCELAGALGDKSPG
jgi:DNA-binding CsgD family transcriptional regulator